MIPTNGKARRGLVADINVTPLVDVMLVLLIIFMVTAPMMTQGLDVNLPEATTKSLRQEENPIVVTIDKNGKINLDNFTVSEKVLFQELSKYSKEAKDKPIYLRADRDVAYGNVVSIMADIKRAGFEKLGMITEPSIKENN